MTIKFDGIIEKAAKSNCSVIGFNVFGYEDAISVVKAAEEMNSPVLLMTNKTALEHMPVEYYGKLLRQIAEDAEVPVSVHLDHAGDYNLIIRAIMSGYTSVMYDGSQLPIEENINNTREIVKIAHQFGVLVEAEIGSVAYSDPEINAKEIYTDPEEVKIFNDETDVDWLAVAIGTVHRMKTQEANIQYDRLSKIQEKINIPLVIHGSSGISDKDLSKMTKYKIGKFNIGTSLRMAFGNTLRKEFKKYPEEFDRIKLFKKPMLETKKEAKRKMRLLGLQDFCANLY
jgi:fructose-bisphosphate aldolase class II